MRRSVVTLWVMLMTLQMIAHMTLIKSLMPQELSMYLKNVLDVIRLKFTKETEVFRPQNMWLHQAGYNFISL